MNRTKRCVYFGNEQLSTGAKSKHAPIFDTLVKIGYRPKALIIHQQGKASSAVEKLAKKNNVPVVKVSSNQELERELMTLNADFAVLAAYGKMVPNTIIESFEHGIINIHPSLLPKYRGPTPIEQGLLNADPIFGVSLMQLAEKMDAGPVYAQEKFHFHNNTTKLQLTEKLAQLGAEMLKTFLPDILSGALPATPQDESLASYCQLIQKKDGVIDTTKPATLLEREILAYAGWPKSTLHYKNLDIIIHSANAVQTKATEGKLVRDEKRLLLGCKSSSLDITSLQIAGKKIVDAQSFLNGYSSILT